MVLRGQLKTVEVDVDRFRLSDEQVGISFVGAGGRMVATADGPLIVYQDASSLDLKLAELTPAGPTTQVLLNEGAHGFYSDVALSDDTAYIANVEARLDHRDREADHRHVNGAHERARPLLLACSAHRAGMLACQRWT